MSGCSAGSLAFWGNGKFLGVVKDNEAKSDNLPLSVLLRGWVQLDPTRLARGRGSQ